MALTVGSRVGHYSVTALIGEGGMGLVYRATDAQLGRDVALKILPDAFASDPDRLARFRREAQVLASLNHPHIAQIYGTEEDNADGTRALVLELVEGPTLADRIADGPIPIDEAVPIARQIAEAVEAAHEAGVIHRDLKPANIKVREDGTVKVLDFGLAKAFQPDPSAASASMSPTISLTAAATQMGMVMGTAAYMAPEQAKGLPVDKRADIWAYGAVLFEMLTGKKLFDTGDVSEMLASVLVKEPDISSLGGHVPAHIRSVVRQCLVKDPRLRLRDIGDVRLAMAGVFDTRSPAASESTGAVESRFWQQPLAILSMVFLAVAAGGLAVWSLPERDPPRPTRRFTVTLPDSERLPAALSRLLALSPDGQTLVYRVRRTADGQRGLVQRPLAQFEAAPIVEATAGSVPFFSFDGQWLGFFEGGGTGALKKIAMAGGPAQTLTTLPSGFRGAHWGVDDLIVYGGLGGALMQVAAAGGEPTVLFEPADQRRAGYPQVLEGGEGGDVLFTVTDQARVGVELHILDRATGEHRLLLPAAAAGRVVDTGHLVFARSGALWAVPWDDARLDVIGTPVPVVEGVRVDVLGTVQYDVAGDGTLAYIPGTAAGSERTLVWVDREGNEERLPAPAAQYVTMSVSPDGERAALAVDDGRGSMDIWISELARGTLTRLTTDAAIDHNPLWDPEGRRVVFRSDRNGRPELFWQPADGSPPAELLLSLDEPVVDIIPGSWSPDGRTLFLSAEFPDTRRDIGMVSIDGDRVWQPLLQTPAHEYAPAISPDGRWLAYSSRESGSFEVYAQRFPEMEGRQPISVGGGYRPTWSPDGDEIVYIRGPNGPPEAVMRVPVDATRDPASLVVGQPVELFDFVYASAVAGHRYYDLSADAERLLVIAAGAGASNPLARSTSC